MRNLAEHGWIFHATIMGKFYYITSEAVGGPNYPWAAGYGPLAEMPYFEHLNPDSESSLRRFWEINPLPPGMEIDPGGKVWSDVIGCGNGPPNNFYSEKIIFSLETAGIPLLRTTRMPIGKIRARRLQSIPPPNYFVIESIPGMSVDYEAMGVATDGNGRPKYTNEQILNPPKMVLDLDSWTGLDLFSFSNRGGPVNLFCTERIRLIAETEGWTNVKFKPIG